MEIECEMSIFDYFSNKREKQRALLEKINSLWKQIFSDPKYMEQQEIVDRLYQKYKEAESDYETELHKLVIIEKKLAADLEIDKVEKEYKRKKEKIGIRW